MGRRPRMPESKTLEKGLELNPESNNNNNRSCPAEEVNKQTEPSKPALQRVDMLRVSSSAVTYPKKSKKKHLSTVRRSQRLQNSVVTTPARNMDVERVIEDITIVESEKGEEEYMGAEEDEDEVPPEPEPEPEVVAEPEPVVNGKNLEEKVHYLEQLLEEQKKVIDGLKSKPVRRGFYGEGAVLGELTYKNLYIESQKKVEVLLEENHQLVMKLENARGQIEVYEKGFHDKWKDMLVISSLTRATEVAANAALHTGLDSKKRKKDDNNN